MKKRQPKGTLYDGQYYITLEFSDDINLGAGKYVTPCDDKAGRIIVNGDQPEIDRAIALTHEINHHVEWTRTARRVFVSHAALDYHADRFMTLLQNSPKLAEYFYLFSKKGA